MCALFGTVKHGLNLNVPPRNSSEGMTELQELYRIVGNLVKIRNA